MNEQWWTDHNKLALTARFMETQGSEIGDIIYMLEKPWKHSDEYNLADAELATEE